MKPFLVAAALAVSAVTVAPPTQAHAAICAHLHEPDVWHPGGDLPHVHQDGCHGVGAGEDLDPAICATLVAVAPAVNHDPSVLYIDATGDTYVLGEFFWDCPPYVEE